MFEKNYFGAPVPFRVLFLPLAAALLAAGCAITGDAPDQAGAARATGTRDARPTAAIADSATPARAKAPASATVPEVLTLRDALSLALERSPKLAEVSWETQTAAGTVLQAGLRPNPEVEVAVEEFAGAGGRRGLRGAESSVQLSQQFELAGKRAKRTRVAELGRDLAGIAYQSTLLDVHTETAKAFVEVLAGQQLVALKLDLLRLADQVLDAAGERVAAGRAAPVEETRARLQLESSRIDAERARRRLQAARIRLASAWGSHRPAFARAEGEFGRIPDPPAAGWPTERLAENPDVARPRSEVALRKAALALERARDTPDLTVTTGFTRFEETDDQAFVVGISLPLPVFGLNPGGVLAAEQRLAQGRDAERAAVLGVRLALEQTHQRALALHSEVITLDREVVPGAGKAFDVVRQGYREGKFAFLEVLDAQRTLFETRERHIEALAAYRRALLDLERLSGRMSSPRPGAGASPR